MRLWKREVESRASLPARSRLRTGAAPLAVAVWVRHLQVVGGSVAVVIVVPEDEPKSAIRSVAAVLGPEAVDVAVGTLNRQWRIERVTPNSAVVLGRDQGELADVDLSSLVHPDDVGLLLGSVRDTAQASEGALVRLRLHHATRGWVETRCLLFPLPEDESSPMAFVLAETGGEVSPASDAERIATLERHLLRFAAELHAGGWRKAEPLAVDASRFAALDELPRRQGEIVERLLRGERIPSIAASMYISASTVRNHLSRVFATFGVHSQSELLTLLRSGSGHVHPGEPAPHPGQ